MIAPLLGVALALAAPARMQVSATEFNLGLSRHSIKAGRESRFVLDPKPIVSAQAYLEHVSRQWDDALARLKALVEG